MGTDLDINLIPKCIQFLNNTENLLLELVECLNGTNPNDYCKYLPEKIVNKNNNNNYNNEVFLNNSIKFFEPITSTATIKTKKVITTTQPLTKSEESAETSIQITKPTTKKSLTKTSTQSSSTTSFLSRFNTETILPIPEATNKQIISTSVHLISSLNIEPAAINYKGQQSLPLPQPQPQPQQNSDQIPNNHNGKLEVKMDKISNVLFLLSCVSTILVFFNLVGFSGFVYLIFSKKKKLLTESNTDEKMSESTRTAVIATAVDSTKNVKLENGNANFAFSSTYL